MRKLAYLFSSAVLMTACEMLPSNNGDLDGFWQMTCVDTLSSAGSCDTRNNLIFWSVQKHLLEMKDMNNSAKNVFFRFSRETDKLIISNPIIDCRDSSDIVLRDTSILYNYGIHRVPDTLTIEVLNSSQMILHNSLFRLSFRKY